MKKRTSAFILLLTLSPVIVSVVGYLLLTSYAMPVTMINDTRTLSKGEVRIYNYTDPSDIYYIFLQYGYNGNVSIEFNIPDYWYVNFMVKYNQTKNIFTMNQYDRGDPQNLYNNQYKTAAKWIFLNPMPNATYHTIIRGNGIVYHSIVFDKYATYNFQVSYMSVSQKQASDTATNLITFAVFYGMTWLGIAVVTVLANPQTTKRGEKK